jgi:hypothetical protein
MRIHAILGIVSNQLRRVCLQDPLAEREQLLSTPISVLLERVNQLEFAEAREAAGLSDGLASNTKAQENGEVESQLWVDKYAPRLFTELLSDEVHSLFELAVQPASQSSETLTLASRTTHTYTENQ